MSYSKAAPQTRLFKKGEYVMLSEEAFDNLPKLSLAEAKIAIGPVKIRWCMRVEVTGFPLHQSLCLELGEGYNVSSCDVTLAPK